MTYDLRACAGRSPRRLQSTRRLLTSIRHIMGRSTRGVSLDRIQTGVVLLTDAGRVLFANRMAQSLAAGRDGFRLDADGPAAADPEESRQLRRLVALAGQRDHLGGGVLRLSRPSGKSPLVAFVSPLTNPTPLGLAARSLVAIFVTDPEAGPVLDGDTLKTAYRLSPLEVHIAQRLVRGETLGDIAQAQGLTVNTTRWYMKQILQKTGAASQADAVRVLITGPAAIGQATGS